MTTLTMYSAGQCIANDRHCDRRVKDILAGNFDKNLEHPPVYANSYYTICFEKRNCSIFKKYNVKNKYVEGRLPMFNKSVIVSAT